MTYSLTVTLTIFSMNSLTISWTLMSCGTTVSNSIIWCFSTNFSIIFSTSISLGISITFSTTFSMICWTGICYLTISLTGTIFSTVVGIYLIFYWIIILSYLTTLTFWVSTIFSFIFSTWIGGWTVSTWTWTIFSTTSMLLINFYWYSTTFIAFSTILSTSIGTSTIRVVGFST